MSTLQAAARLWQFRDEVTTIRGEGTRVLCGHSALLREYVVDCRLLEDPPLWSILRPRGPGCARPAISWWTAAR